MAATRLEWAAAHLGLEGDQVETLRAILATVYEEGLDEGWATYDSMYPPERPYGYPE